MAQPPARAAKFFIGQQVVPLTPGPGAGKLRALEPEETNAQKSRWGVLGGTFDPPHLGHFSLAQSAADELALERVLWVPSAQPPHKQDRPLSPFVARATMAEMTARRDRRFDVSRIESSIKGTSYTVKTLAHLGTALPEMELFFIVGADVLPELPTWYHPERISRWATLACGVRPGHSRPDPKALPVERVVYFQGPELEISSTRIRQLAADGSPFEEMVTPDVARYIIQNRLYSTD